MPARLIIDTDTAGDDVFSIMLAMAAPQVSVEAITVVCGNVDFAQQVRNALYTIEMMQAAGKAPAAPEVYPGCEQPLLGRRVGSERVQGNDGMGEAGFPPPRRTAADEHGALAIVRIANLYPGEVDLLAHGPLTNVAVALKLDPRLPEKIRRLVFMGGTNNSRGNISPAAEFNVYVDPLAARMVVEAGFNLTIVPWTTTLSHGIFTVTQLDAIAGLGTPLSAFFGQVNSTNRKTCLARGYAGSTHPDSQACAVLLDESLITGAADYFVDVETEGRTTRGYLLVDTAADLARPANARMVEGVDTEAFYRMVVNMLA